MSFHRVTTKLFLFIADAAQASRSLEKINACSRAGEKEVMWICFS